LIIIVGLTLTQLVTFASVRYERDVALRDLMMTNIVRDIASSVALLDRLPASERAAWFEKLERRNYSFEDGGSVEGMPPSSASLRPFTEAIVRALRPFEVTRVAQVPSVRETVLIQVQLHDASLLIRARRVDMPVSDWVTWALLLQLAVLSLCAWLAVRLVTRPLAQLASAADRLGPDLKGETLREQGPAEVAQAARAFNAMQRRIAGYMSERVEILAAISHDLQTPITRMRLRADMMDNETDRDKFRQDLEAMQLLVKEGVAYARTLHGATETPRRLDVDALLESMVSDYQETGHLLTLEGRAGTPVVTGLNALRRILINLIDNALKFGTRTHLRLLLSSDCLSISVIDNGPGIPPNELEAVLRPFYRVESSRNRETGGTGLGLAIAHQLALALGSKLTLHNRTEGGLEARLDMPLA
jgi:signal transduction histidine kinase